jgi:murein DD-endopeptidase MepM/ murein hydrolase activator NlpD
MSGEKGEILAQHPRRLGAIRRGGLALLLLCVPALSIVTAFGIAPGTAPIDVQSHAVIESLPVPEGHSAATGAQTFVSQERVLRGDTVAALFDRLGVADARALDFLRTDAAGRTIFRQLVPGRMIQARTGMNAELLELRYFVSAGSLLEVEREGEGFRAKVRAVAEAPRIVYAAAEIRSSLFAATDTAGIPDAIAMQVTRIFATDIDFHVDLRKGDRLAIAYEMVYEAGELVGPGRILAAELVNDAHAYYAVLFHDEDGKDSYYSLDGANRAKAFLRSPVEFSRVSSGFGARFHPIFKNWRAHTGVDFAAPQGTRVLAAADGIVVSAGARGGYGNAVEIRHGGSIATLYGHLSRFAKGIHSGARVRQGDPIGYVGMTGWATGPHLHYEFKIAGMHKDPLRVALPKADPVSESARPRFMQAADQARTSMDFVDAAPAARFE